MQHLSDQTLSELSEKWLKGTISADELALLEEWYNHTSQESINWTAGDLDEEQLKERLYNSIDQHVATGKPARYFGITKTLYAVAASIAVIIGTTIGYMQLKNEGTNNTTTAPLAVVSTGSYNKAILTLANGQTMVLDDAANGVIAQQGNTKIQKTRDGEILYNAQDDGIADVALSVNTISTPKGGQYNISLPDGTKVWLNAASTLQFPTAFKGKERVVRLTGEAYFEVAKDKAVPFKVKMSDETSIIVLGTHFNIMAYPEERKVNATLLEGSIRVQKGSLNKMLVPGEMAQVTDKIALHKVNAEEMISWKNGLFRFENTDVRTVMHEIERWYNVDVIYEGAIPGNKITGFVSRTSQLSEVIKMLELSGLQLKMLGNKIKIWNN